MNVPESLPQGMRSLVEEILRSDQRLLAELQDHRTPTPTQRKLVLRLLLLEFSNCLDENYEPSQRGRDIDELLGRFLQLWPI